MKSLVRSLLVLVLVLLAGRPAAYADDAVDILGVWEPVGMENAGTALAAEQVKSLAEKMRFTITKEKIVMAGMGAEVGYALDEKATPKGIDTVDLNGEAKGELSKGIYELRGDVLRLCMAKKDAPRPRKFATGADTEAGDLLLTFLRKK